MMSLKLINFVTALILFLSLSPAQAMDVSVDQFAAFATNRLKRSALPVHESLPSNLFPEPIYRSRFQNGTPRFGAALTEKYIHATGETISISTVFELVNPATRSGFVSLRIALRGPTLVSKQGRLLRAFTRLSGVSMAKQQVQFYNDISDTNGAFIDIDVNGEFGEMTQKVKQLHKQVSNYEQKGFDAYLRGTQF
ncbi:MAG: hypothetical protein ACK5Y2_12715 [Bdellovibrionales bacterium]